MFAVEFSFLCESPSGGRRQQARRTGLLTQQQRVFEYVPEDAAAARIICVNPQITLVIITLLHVFHLFFS